MTKRLLWTLLIAALAVIGAPVAAQAAPPVSAEPAICSGPLPTADKIAAGCDGYTAPAPNRSYLPAQRWADSAVSLHYRTGDGIMNDLATRLQRDAQFPMWMSTGNWAYSTATSAVTGALEFDILRWTGAAVDRFVASVGKAMFSSGLIALGVVVSILAVLWRMYRGHGDMKRLLRSILVVALLGVMVMGAMKSTGTPGSSFRPGKGSPGWFAVTMNDVVGTVASIPAGAILVDSDLFPGMATPDKKAGVLSCDAYTKRLVDSYIESGGGSNQISRQASASVPLVLSRMWEQTGLRTWVSAQYGNDNNLGTSMYCRLLEERAAISPRIQADLTNSASGMKMPKANPLSAAWGTGGETEARDRSQIAWAACRVDSKGSWFIHPEWTKVERQAGWLGVGGKSNVTVQECQEWWGDAYFTDSGPGGIINNASAPFEFPGTSGATVNDTRDAPEARDFLLTLHGSGGSVAGGAMVMAYAFSSVMVLIVFGILSLVIIGAKLFMGVSMIGLFFAGIRDIFINDASALAKSARMFIGMAFVVWGMILVLALVALITGSITASAATAFGSSSTMAMVWTGIAPIAALIILHLVFVKALKVPSPLSIGGAKAWGNAAANGGIGRTAVVAGGSALAAGGARKAWSALKKRGKGTASGLASGGGKRQGASVQSASAGGPGAKLDTNSGARRGRMSPGRAGATTATASGGAPTAAATSGLAGAATTAAAAGVGAGAGAAAVSSKIAGPATPRVGAAVDGDTADGAVLPGKDERREVHAQTRKDARKAHIEGQRTARADGATTRREVAAARKAEAGPGRLAAARTAWGELGDQASGQGVSRARIVAENAVDSHRAKRADKTRTRIARRGYDGGIAGSMREAITARAKEVASNAKAKPIRTGAKVLGTGLLTVATGGAVVPVLGAAAAFKTVRAQRRVVNSHERLTQAAAAQREQDKRQEQGSKAKDSTPQRRISKAPAQATSAAGEGAAPTAPTQRSGQKVAGGRTRSANPPRVTRASSGRTVSPGRTSHRPAGSPSPSKRATPPAVTQQPTSAPTAKPTPDAKPKATEW